MKIKTSNQNIKSRFLSTLAITIIILSMIPVAQSIEISCERYQESEKILNYDDYHIKITEIFIGRIQNVEIKEGHIHFDAVNLINIYKFSINDDNFFLFSIYRNELGPYTRITTLEASSFNFEKYLSFNVLRRESGPTIRLSTFADILEFKGILTHRSIFSINQMEYEIEFGFDDDWIGPDEIPNIEFLKTTLANH